MYINKSRVQNVDKYLTLFKEDENVTVILTDLITFEKQLRNMGFSQEFDIGEQLLPTIVGPKSRVNAIGKEIILDDLPKLTFYVSQDRDFKDWHGNNHSCTIDIPYKKFQREYRPPLHKGTKCDMRFKSSLNSARLNLLNPYK
jgi:hypothetical protein